MTKTKVNEDEWTTRVSVARSESRLTVHGQGSLVLSNVTSRDTGLYTCRATNAHDDSADAVAYVRVIGTLRHTLCRMDALLIYHQHILFA